MRNWNDRWGIKRHCHSLCFQPTYEELKLLTKYSTETSRAGFQPTYEELKRSWFGPTYETWTTCFQPTYEELKPLFVELFWFRPLRFQPTYEELKQVWPITCHAWSSFRFQPTYEELKLRARKNHHVAFRVFSLPMRNWNPSRSMSIQRINSFSAYLWGIETPLPTTPEGSGAGGVFSLPMRNWNPE